MGYMEYIFQVPLFFTVKNDKIAVSNDFISVLMEINRRHYF